MRVELAIEFHNRLHGTTWPKCFPLHELARQTRMVLGTLEIFGLKTRQAWEQVLFTAIDAAFMAGYKVGDMKPPTEAEMAASMADPEFQKGLKRAQEQVALMLGKWKLRDALLRVAALGWCDVRAWEKVAYVHVVASCLACGAHVHGYPDKKRLDSWYEGTYASFLINHGGCL